MIIRLRIENDQEGFSQIIDTDKFGNLGPECYVDFVPESRRLQVPKTVRLEFWNSREEMQAHAGGK